MKKLNTGDSAVIDPKEVSNGDSTTSTTEDVLMRFIKRRHPTYDAKQAHWSFLDSCYEGGREWFTKDNIFKYIKEGRIHAAMIGKGYRFTKGEVDAFMRSGKK